MGLQFSCKNPEIEDWSCQKWSFFHYVLAEAESYRPGSRPLYPSYWLQARPTGKKNSNQIGTDSIWSRDVPLRRKSGLGSSRPPTWPTPCKAESSRIRCMWNSPRIPWRLRTRQTASCPSGPRYSFEAFAASTEPKLQTSSGPVRNPVPQMSQ